MKKRKKEEEEEWSSSNWLLEADRRKRPIKKLQSESCLTLSPTDLRKKKLSSAVSGPSPPLKKKKKKNQLSVCGPWCMIALPVCQPATDDPIRGADRETRSQQTLDLISRLFPQAAAPVCFFSFSSFFIASDWLVSVLGRNAIISGPSNYSQPGRVGLSVWAAPSIKLQTDHCTCLKMGK